MDGISHHYDDLCIPRVIPKRMVEMDRFVVTLKGSTETLVRQSRNSLATMKEQGGTLAKYFVNCVRSSQSDNLTLGWWTTSRERKKQKPGVASLTIFSYRSNVVDYSLCRLEYLFILLPEGQNPLIRTEPTAEAETLFSSLLWAM